MKRIHRPDETITSNANAQFNTLIQYPNPRVPLEPASIEPTSIDVVMGNDD
jgi:hypothetical protein